MFCKQSWLKTLKYGQGSQQKKAQMSTAKQGLKLALSPLMVKKIRLETFHLMPTRTGNSVS